MTGNLMQQACSNKNKQNITGSKLEYRSISIWSREKIITSLQYNKKKSTCVLEYYKWLTNTEYK